MSALGRVRRYLVASFLSAAGVVILWPAAASIAPAQAADTSYTAPSVPAAVYAQQAKTAGQNAAARAIDFQAQQAAQAAAAAAAAQAAQQAAAQAAAARPAQQAAVQVSPPAPAAAPAISAGSLQAYALQLLGGDQTQFSCLNSVIMHESSWNVYASNGSGAYGIPQALPGSKMAAAGPDWATNGDTQLRWMIQMYIPGTYGSACNAYAHEQAYGWY
jgi:hypothetical protein